MSKYDVKTLNDPNDKTVLEKKHVPFITAPDSVEKGEVFEVTVKMGKEIDHPMEEGHFIEFFDVYAGDMKVANVTFTPECEAEATLKLKLDESVTLTVEEYCNLHGYWKNEKEIEVK